MRNGPGPASLTRASSQWTELGYEVSSLKWQLDVMLSGLAKAWSGEAAMQVINAAKPFQEWLVDLVDQIANIARQTHYIMVAFCLAHNSMVDPALINANRTQMLALTNDNELGQNTAAIAQLEHEYADYWDQDGDAMRTYRHDLSFALTRLTPWQQPPPIATNTGLVQPIPRAEARFGL
ncbi:hypothetical protein B586_04770 [Mycobacterium haemophilum DSM 44634]|nr:hypothetical protein B586_04770 [Mycobacterium haemophilum DSM 44634]